MSARPPRRRTTSLRERVLALLTALLLAGALAGCGGDPGAKKVDTDGDGRPDTPASEVPSATPTPPNPRAGIATVGQCTDLTPQQSRGTVAVAAAVPCRRAHTSVVAYAGLVPEAVTNRTPFARRSALAAKVCVPAFRRLAGGTPAQRATSVLTWIFLVPTSEQLARGARWVRCDVVARSGRELVPLPPRSPVLRTGLPEELRVCQNRAGTDVSCARPHAFRVEAVFASGSPAYPGADFALTARTRCAALTQKPGLYWQPPSRQGWAAGDRFIRCLSATS